MNNNRNTIYLDKKIHKLEVWFYILSLIFTSILTKVIKDEGYKILALILEVLFFIN